MIKTLRITTIVAAILAGLIIVFPVAFGVRADVEAEQFLNSPGAIEKFKQTQSHEQKDDTTQSSPLVKQAQAFALYLNPPPVAKQTIPMRRQSIIPPKPLKASAQFKLIATSVHETRPEESLAFISEPGSGLRWIRPGDEVGHVTIEQIKNGLIVYRDQQGTSTELSAEPRQPEISLLEGAASASSVVSSQVAPTLPSTAPSTAPAVKTRPSVTMSRPTMPEISPAESEALEGLVEKLRALQIGPKSDKTTTGRSPEANAAMMEKLISDFRSMRVDAQEAKKLDDLGKKLNGTQQDPNRIGTDRGQKQIGLPRPIPRPPRTR